MFLVFRFVLPWACAVFFLAGTTGQARDTQPAVLILEQSGGLQGYADIAANLRSAVLAQTAAPVIFYTESLDLSHFNSADYRELLDTYLRGKFRDKKIDVIVALGARSLEYAVSLRTGAWANLPVVFAAVSDEAIKQQELPANVTGQTIRISFADAVVAAKAMVPGLKRIALVGDRIESQTFRFHLAAEMPLVKSQVELIDLTGLPIGEVKKRVADLPGDAAVQYTTINVDGDGKVFAPAAAFGEVFKSANRPIVVDVENRVGWGGTGGFVLVPSRVGEEAGKLTARILGGEHPSAIPISMADAMRPVFNWRQLQRWRVSESRLPPGSEIRFRELSMWEQYYWRIVIVAGGLALQTVLIFGLIYEDRRRRMAEAQNQTLMIELSHLNRVATVGELTASIAHEVRQPLAAIVTSGAAGLNWLKAKVPDLEEVRVALQNIVKEGHRADDVIKNIRAMFRNETPSRVQLDVNRLIREVLELTARKIAAENVALKTDLANTSDPLVKADPIQLQQVFLNLIMNAVDAMSSKPDADNLLLLTSNVENGSVVVTVEDTGPGIDPGKVDQIFKAFVTTKPGGMGLGLAICKSIIEAHGGQLSASNRAGRGAVFRIVLPAAGEPTP